MIKSFLKYIEFEKRYSIHTVISYKNDLEQFNVFLSSLEEPLTLVKANYSHIRAWIISLVEDKITPSSINRKMASLRSYYKFLIKSGVLQKDPSKQLKALKTPQRLPQFAQEAEMQRLFDVNFGKNFGGVRDQLLLELLYATGMRRAELMTLKISSINSKKRQIKVLGKRNQERIIPLNIEVAKLVQKYLQLREVEFMSGANDFLLLTDKGQPLYETFVYRKVKKYLGAVTSLEKNSPHILRHTFATHLLNNGADLNAVKELLGHASLAATQIYTHNSLDKLKQVFEKAHPKA